MALPVIGTISEFMNIPAGEPNAGYRLTGTCGQTALHCAESAAARVKPTQLGMYGIYKEMYQNGKCDKSGASTMSELLWSVQRHPSYKVLKVITYQEPLNSTTLTSDLRTYAGVKPIVLEVAHAYNLRDIETGVADEAGVMYHYIAVLGKQADGYICADGDNAQSKSGKMSIYSLTTILNARPCAFMMLDVLPVPAPPAPKGDVMLEIAQTLGYFTDAGNGRWNCKNSKYVQGAILDFYRAVGNAGSVAQLNGLSLLGLPVSLEIAPDSAYAGRVQVFERGAIVYDPNNKWDTPPGIGSSVCYVSHLDSNSPALAFLESDLKAQLDKANADALAAEKARDAATASVTSLTAQVAVLKAQLAAIPPAPVVDPLAQPALDEMKSLKSFLGKLS